MSGSSRVHVGVVTITDDLHVDIVSAGLRARGHDVTVVLADRLPGLGGLSWRADTPTSGVIRDASGRRVSPADFDVVWWRRTGEARVPDRVIDDEARQYVRAAADATTSGFWCTTVSGRWVSDPDATRRAENKIVQLRAAVDAGLMVPRTIISQDPADIREFAETLRPHEMVGKSVTGVRGLGLAAGVVTDAMLGDDAALSLAPTIYQELVPGTRHLRVCCFGTTVIAATIDARELDWRYESDVDVRKAVIEPGLGKQLVDVTHRLGLRMGIFDLKVRPDGCPVWLEINPQGQFLFLEALGGLPLADAMADFLVSEAERDAGVALSTSEPASSLY